MSLVLAIQPDPEQAERLASICRRIGAELVLAATARAALATLGDRIPDVILSAPLLPEGDEAAIAKRLRALGDDALHVQAIGAPILGDLPVEEPGPRGLLKAFRSPRPAAGPAVCDPVTFAGELSGHLLRAVAERAAITTEPIEAPVPGIVAAVPRVEDLWPHQRVSAPGDSSEVRLPSSPPTQLRLPDATAEVRQKPDTARDVRLEPDTTQTDVVPRSAGDRHVPRRATSLLPRRGGSAKRECGSRTPDPAPRIPDPDAPVDIELISLVDAIAQESPPRKRTRQAGQHRRKRPVYDDAAYFDPAQSEFSAVVDRFDEFAREHSRR